MPFELGDIFIDSLFFSNIYKLIRKCYSADKEAPSIQPCPQKRGTSDVVHTKAHQHAAFIKKCAFEKQLCLIKPLIRGSTLISKSNQGRLLRAAVVAFGLLRLNYKNWN